MHSSALLAFVLCAMALPALSAPISVTVHGPDTLPIPTGQPVVSGPNTLPIFNDKRIVGIPGTGPASIKASVDHPDQPVVPGSNTLPVFNEKRIVGIPGTGPASIKAPIDQPDPQNVKRQEHPPNFSFPPDTVVGPRPTNVVNFKNSGIVNNKRQATDTGAPAVPSATPSGTPVGTLPIPNDPLPIVHGPDTLPINVGARDIEDTIVSVLNNVRRQTVASNPITHVLETASVPQPTQPGAPVAIPLGKQAAPGKRDAPRPVAIGSSLGPGGQVIPFDPISGSNAPGKRTPVVALDPTTGRIIPRPETLPDGEPNLSDRDVQQASSAPVAIGTIIGPDGQPTPIDPTLRAENPHGIGKRTPFAIGTIIGPDGQPTPIDPKLRAENPHSVGKRVPTVVEDPRTGTFSTLEGPKPTQPGVPQINPGKKRQASIVAPPNEPIAGANQPGCLGFCRLGGQ